MLDDLITKFLYIADQADRVVAADIPWKTKFSFVFSDAIAGAVRDIGIQVDWYDPDTSYEEDVMAYVNALREKADELRKIQ